jgi:hypothetical protein
MRLLFATVSSAVLLSACSWFSGHSGHQAHNGQQAYGAYGAGPVQNHRAKNHRAKNHHAKNRLGPCQIQHRSQPAPRGCKPEQVTLATSGNPYGGFPQQPNFSGGYGADFATGGFGSHSQVKRSAVDYHVSDKAEKRRPKLRGQLYFGGEKSIAGDLIDLDGGGVSLPAAYYNPNNFNEGSTTGLPSNGQVVTTTYTSEIEQIRQDNVSFEDAYSTPLNIRGGFEYIIGPQTSLFANAGYSYAEGERASATVQAELQRFDRIEGFSPEVAIDPNTGNQVPTGQFISTGVSTNIGFIPNVDVARFGYEFSDLERIDLEVGARQYLSPVLTQVTNASVTPFIGGSVGAARYNNQSVNVTQEQLFLERAFESNAQTLDFFDALPNRGGTVINNVDLFDAQWVPTGTLTAGLEWQATPKTAIAFETGLRYERGREDINNVRGDNNVSIPFTIRGSYNF